MEIMFYSLRRINRFFRVLHSSGLWLTGQTQREAAGMAREFCEGFSQLAAMQAAGGFRMFKIRPKMRMFLELVRQNAGPHWALNPINASCWNDEDFIGRCSAVSRSCYGLGLSQSLRCLQKVLGKYRHQFSNANVWSLGAPADAEKKVHQPKDIPLIVVSHHEPSRLGRQRVLFGDDIWGNMIMDLETTNFTIYFGELPIVENYHFFLGVGRFR